MQEIIISQTEYGQRLDKLLLKYFSQASSGFIYKMLRKKNITLNKDKATGKEILQMGDRIQIYFSEETFEKFRRSPQDISMAEGKLSILYEDDHILIINKPVGMLSQKAEPSDISAVEEITAYLLNSGQLSEEALSAFRPGVCNRLDRNTSGILVAGKTMIGLQIMNQAFAERTLHKYYLCPVQGILEKSMELDGYLEKDATGNIVKIKKDSGGRGTYVRTDLRPLEKGKNATLLEVELITGKSHQIRAHLAAVSHPIFGDFKYGNPMLNQKLKSSFGLKHQLLHAYKLVLPQLPDSLAYLSGKSFTAPLPKMFEDIWESYKA